MKLILPAALLLSWLDSPAWSFSVPNVHSCKPNDGRGRLEFHKNAAQTMLRAVAEEKGTDNSDDPEPEPREPPAWMRNNGSKTVGIPVDLDAEIDCSGEVVPDVSGRLKSYLNELNRGTSSPDNYDNSSRSPWGSAAHPSFHGSVTGWENSVADLKDLEDSVAGCGGPAWHRDSPMGPPPPPPPRPSVGLRAYYEELHREASMPPGYFPPHHFPPDDHLRYPEPESGFGGGGLIEWEESVARTTPWRINSSSNMCIHPAEAGHVNNDWIPQNQDANSVVPEIFDVELEIMDHPYPPMGGPTAAGHDTTRFDGAKDQDLKSANAEGDPALDAEVIVGDTPFDATDANRFRMVDTHEERGKHKKKDTPLHKGGSRLFNDVDSFSGNLKNKGVYDAPTDPSSVYIDVDQWTSETQSGPSSPSDSQGTDEGGKSSQPKSWDNLSSNGQRVHKNGQQQEQNQPQRKHGRSTNNNDVNGFKSPPGQQRNGFQSPPGQQRNGFKSPGEQQNFARNGSQTKPSAMPNQRGNPPKATVFSRGKHVVEEGGKKNGSTDKVNNRVASVPPQGMPRQQQVHRDHRRQPAQSRIFPQKPLHAPNPEARTAYKSTFMDSEIKVPSWQQDPDSRDNTTNNMPGTPSVQTHHAVPPQMSTNYVDSLEPIESLDGSRPMDRGGSRLFGSFYSGAASRSSMGNPPHHPENRPMPEGPSSFHGGMNGSQRMGARAPNSLESFNERIRTGAMTFEQAMGAYYESHGISHPDVVAPKASPGTPWNPRNGAPMEKGGSRLFRNPGVTFD